MRLARGAWLLTAWFATSQVAAQAAPTAAALPYPPQTQPYPAPTYPTPPLPPGSPAPQAGAPQPGRAEPALPAHGTLPPGPIGGDSAYTLALGGPLGPSWSPSDEAWYRRNRRFAIAGKVMTVVGVALLAGGLPSFRNGVVIAGFVSQDLGQLLWAAADLRAANEMRRRGFSISKAPGVAAVLGALFLAPVVWMTGPVQSALLREVHDGLTLARPPRFTARGLGLQAQF